MPPGARRTEQPPYRRREPGGGASLVPLRALPSAAEMWLSQGNMWISASGRPAGRLGEMEAVASTLEAEASAGVCLRASVFAPGTARSRRARHAAGADIGLDTSVFCA